MEEVDRKAYNFYKSHWEQIKLLNKDQQHSLFIAICKVQFLEVNIEDISFSDAISNLVWTGIKHSIATSINGFVNKQKALNKAIVLPLAKGLDKGSNEVHTEELNKEGAQQGKEEEEEKGEEQEKVVSKDTVAKAPIFFFKKELVNIGVNPKMADEWIKVRKAKRATNTKTAFDALRRQFDKSGLPPDKCVRIAVENSWSGFKAEWIKNNHYENTPGNNSRIGKNSRTSEAAAGLAARLEKEQGSTG